MPLRRLEITGIRNLEPLRLGHLGRINLIVGPNGSGKTSILEAIYLLGMGRSFRGVKIQPLITRGEQQCVVYAEVEARAGSASQSIGVARTASGSFDAHVDRISGVGRAELARALPLQLINAETFGLIDDGPVVRRQLMDWGAFHVKPAFLDDWRRAVRCLKQRNHLLKQAKAGQHVKIDRDELDIWTKELVACGRRMDHVRREYVSEFTPLFFDVLSRMMGISGLGLHYQSGWGKNEDFLAAIDMRLQQDLESGRTSLGPHRASIEILLDGQPAADFLSRGQKKLVVAALKLAQGWHLAQKTGVRCTYLVDDLASELDLEHRAAFCRVLDGTGCQAFITAVDADTGLWAGKMNELAMFHVEHGRVLQRV